MKILQYLILLAATVIIFAGCDVLQEDPEENRYFHLALTSVDTASIDEIIIIGVNEGNTDTVDIYTWTKGEKELKTKIRVPGDLNDKFKVIFIARSNGVTEITQSMELDKDSPATEITGTDIPGMREYMSFAVTSHADSQVSETKRVTLSGTLESKHPLEIFTLNGKDVSASGSEWSAVFLFQEGNNTLKFILADTIGNEIHDTLTLVFMDTTAPVFSNLSLSDGDFIASTPVLLSGELSDRSGVLLLTVNGDTVEVDNTVWSVSVDLSPGENRITLAAIDSSASMHTDTLHFDLTYDPTKNDLTPPSLSISAPGDSLTVFFDSILVEGQASDTGSGVASVTVNGANASIEEENWSLKMKLDTGVNTILVESVDSSSNRNKARESVIVTYQPDSTSPEITFTSHSSGEYLSGTAALVKFLVEDGQTGVSWVKINDTEVKVKDGKYELLVTLDKDTTTRIMVTAGDSNLQQNTDSLLVFLNYLNQVPVIDSINDTSIITGQTLTIPLSGRDPDSHDLIYSLLQNLPNSSLSGTQFQWTPDNSQTGEFIITFIATDNGYPKLADSTRVTITVKRSVPSYTFTSNTGHNMLIAVPSGLEILVNGSPIQNGDEIGVFTPEGLCAGKITWAGTAQSITVWGDDVYTEEVIDGALSGQTLTIKVRDTSENTEMEMTAAYTDGNGTYIPNGLYMLTALEEK